MAQVGVFRLQDLPVEIVDDILAHCPATTLTKIARTCRQLLETVRPCLFQEADIQGSRHGTSFVRALERHSDLRFRLRKLTAKLEPLPADACLPPGHWFPSLSKLARDLTMLAIDPNPWCSPVVHMVVLLPHLKALRSLRHLEIRHCSALVAICKDHPIPSVKSLSLPRPAERITSLQHLYAIFPNVENVYIDDMGDSRISDLVAPDITWDALRGWSSVRSLALDLKALPTEAADAFSMMPALEYLRLCVTGEVGTEAFDCELPALVQIELREGSAAARFPAAVAKGRYRNLHEAVLWIGCTSPRWREGIVHAEACMAREGFVEVPSSEYRRYAHYAAGPGEVGWIRQGLATSDPFAPYLYVRPSQLVARLTSSPQFRQ